MLSEIRIYFLFLYIYNPIQIQKQEVRKMAIAGVQQTLLLYTMEKADLTEQLTSIMNKLTLASSKQLDLMNTTTEKKEYYAKYIEQNPKKADTTQYQATIAAVEDDYQLQLAEINNWEKQLEQQQNSCETELKEVTAYEESWNAVLKSNVKKDFTYGQSGS